MELNLILKDMQDPLVRENFARIQHFLALQSLLNSTFKFFEVSVPAGTNVPIKHGLSYIPKDIILTSIISAESASFNFVFEKFDRTNIYVTVASPTTIRFFAGTFNG